MSPSVFKGPTSKEKEGNGKGRERENHLTHPLSQNPGYATA